MFKDKHFIHKFSTPGCNYIYDVNTNAILKVDKKVYDILNTEKEIGDDLERNTSTEYNKILNMEQKGFLQPNKIEEIEHSESSVLSDILNTKLSKITLQITQQCNLRCEYCIYSGKFSNRSHSKKEMTWPMAKKGIDFLKEHSSDSLSINIGFYGGEPLLKFELIKKCIEYAEHEFEGKDLTFSITSNGTIINDEIVQYFKKHNVMLMVSLDGPKEIQNKNRKFAFDGSGTFDKVVENMNYIKDNYPDYFKKITFNSVMDSINDFRCSNDFFTNYETFKESLVNVSLVSSGYAEEEPEISENFVINRRYEIFKLFLSKLNRLDEKYVSKLVQLYFSQIKLYMYDRRIIGRTLPKKVHHGGPCIPGAQRLFMNCDGNFFPCERVSELSEVMNIGNVEDGFYIDKADRLLNIGKITEKQCKNCWAFRFCGLCASAADKATDLSAKVLLSHCKSTISEAENIMKDYCILREFGYRFTDEDKLKSAN